MRFKNVVEARSFLAVHARETKEGIEFVQWIMGVLTRVISWWWDLSSLP